MYIRTYVCVYVHTYVVVPLTWLLIHQILIRTYVYMYVCVYIPTCVCIHMACTMCTSRMFCTIPQFLCHHHNQPTTNPIGAFVRTYTYDIIGFILCSRAYVRTYVCIYVLVSVHMYLHLCIFLYHYNICAYIRRCFAKCQVSSSKPRGCEGINTSQPVQVTFKNVPGFQPLVYHPNRVQQ